ncbi:hypothetical protein BGX24_008962 [Mortierella sp. AD032]|nr:hypothetical protein BGX24_008962 [Mortierella sp. AD032]
MDSTLNIILQGDTPKGHVQAFRSVDKSIQPRTIPLATPEEVIHVDTQFDPETQKEIVLWDDILLAFKNAELVRQKTKIVPFLKNNDFTVLHPLRIAAVPNTVLDVIIDTPAIDAKGTPSDMTPAVGGNPQYGCEATAMENYRYIEVPIELSLALGLQAALDDQAQLVNDPPVPPHPDSGNHPRLRGPQSPTNATEKDLVQLGISASQGDSAAQIALGDMYRDGNGVPQDDQAAFGWYLPAAEQGDPIGQIRLGELYMYGQGVPQDYEKSLEWYLLAANRGCIRAQREVADFYYNGRGVTQDYVRAMAWYRKAADQGDAGSQCKVGSLYEYGGQNGVGYDHLKAAEWYQKAANQGHAFAKKCLRALKDKGMPDK